MLPSSWSNTLGGGEMQTCKSLSFRKDSRLCFSSVKLIITRFMCVQVICPAELTSNPVGNSWDYVFSYCHIYSV